MVATSLPAKLVATIVVVDICINSAENPRAKQRARRLMFTIEME
jgi:hypothetical protein